MLLKDSLNEPDWLSETHPLSEEVSSLSEYKILKNVKLESSALSTQPAQRGYYLFLRLARPSPLSAKTLIFAQRDMLVERVFVSWEAQKSLKHWERKENRDRSNVGKKKEGTKVEEKTFSSHLYYFLSFLHHFHPCIKSSLLMES